MGFTGWLSRIVTGIAILFFAVDAVAHLMAPQPVLDAFTKLQIPMELSRSLGVLQICLIALFLWPTSRILAAILITGYLGGAVAIHLRAGSTPFEIVFPIIVGIMIWGGLFFFDSRAGSMLRKA